MGTTPMISKWAWVGYKGGNNHNSNIMVMDLLYITSTIDIAQEPVIC